MIRTGLVVAVLVAWSLLVATTAGEVLHVEGQILGASLPWSDRLFDERDGPLLGFPVHLAPVPYSGILWVNAQRSLASFQVSIDSCFAEADYCFSAVDLETGHIERVSVPTTYRLAANLFASVVRNDAASLVIDYTSPLQPEKWTTSFALALDKTTGKGEWRWSRGPAIVCTEDRCAPSVPGEEACGAITRFRVVPEPTSLALALLGGVTLMVAHAVCRRVPLARLDCLRQAQTPSLPRGARRSPPVLS
jgi:hypothetical protein